MEPEQAEETPRVAVLGEFPLCEASAIVPAPWDSSLLIVADNEVHDQLFTFRWSGDALRPVGRLAMPASDRPRDIEALAGSGSELLVVGSHSRRRDGSRSPKRHRLRWLRWNGQSLESIAHVDSSDLRLTTTELCLATLFVDPPPEGAARFCEVLVQEPDAINIEGAAVIDQQTWLGLRAPLVNGRAVMLRMSGRALKFTAIQFLALEGNGIRELHASGSTAWGIAGPVPDAPAPFRLFQWTDEVVLGVQLPSFSEGVWIDGGWARVVIDGDVGDEPARCRQSARQQSVRIVASVNRAANPAR